MEIMKLVPAYKDYLWGGTRLREQYGKSTDLSTVAETWECSTHPEGLSLVANGSFSGVTLAEVLQKHPEYLGNKIEKSTELPIIIKFIDAKKDLSIQVHPDDEYALVNEKQNGKTEMWYVVDAETDSSIIHGFAHPVTKELLRTAIYKGTLCKHLNKVKVKKGDLFYVPAGIIHGIGAGTLIAEVQQSSDVTYRLYDYNRKDKNGEKRELHFEKAIEVMNMGITPDIKQKSKLVHYYPGCSRELLIRCKYFETERIQITKGFSFSVLEGSFQVILCLEGEGGIEYGDVGLKPIRFSKGECLFIPAGIGRCHLIGQATLLKIRC